MGSEGPAEIHGFSVDALQASLAKWRKGLSAVQVYPLFSYSVVYSFDIR